MKCSKILGNDIFISQIASWTAHSRNFPNESFALPKLLGVLFESQKLQIYYFRKRKGLLLPCCESFRWCFRGWKSIQIHDSKMRGPVCSIIQKGLAQLVSKLIFTKNNPLVPLLLSNNKKLPDLIITKLENFRLNLALLNKRLSTFTCCCQIVTLAGVQNVDR